MSNEKWIHTGGYINADDCAFTISMVVAPTALCKSVADFGEISENFAHRICEAMNFLASHPDLSVVEVVSKSELEELRSFGPTISGYALSMDRANKQAATLRATNEKLREALSNLVNSVSSGKPDVIGRDRAIVSLPMVEQGRSALASTESAS